MKLLPILLVFTGIVLGMACGQSTNQGEATSGTVQAGNLSVFYTRTGSGSPILLLHAGLLDHTMWAKQVATLSAKYDVITPDLPFHGKTMGLDSIILSADVIRILMDSLHLSKASVAGLSMGSGVALDLAIDYPERVDKVFLISAGLNGYEKEHVLDSVSMAWDTRFSKPWKIRIPCRLL
ncbi:alpha/beta hydrolase [Paraflavitalea speifideaquila]|uniref:alpha/beta fold hydrolase n=1 Tax=Paraflavitalea speifideaquila TaxID=3076558 RepID=UPI0028E52F14|nr:alpha/beta hydrolase [Paraflavitalea speifideiaquila]